MKNRSGREPLPEKPSVRRYQRRRLPRDIVVRARHESREYSRLLATREEWTPLAVPYQHGWRKHIQWNPPEGPDDLPVADSAWQIFLLVKNSVWCRDRRFVRKPTRAERRQRRVAEVPVELHARRISAGEYAVLPRVSQQHFRPRRVKERGKPTRTVWEVTGGWLQAWTTQVVEPCIVTHVRLPNSEKEEARDLLGRHLWGWGWWRYAHPEGKEHNRDYDWDTERRRKQQAALDREAREFVDNYGKRVST